VAVDTSGNIYIADNGNARVVEDQTSGVNFATIPAVTSSTTQTLTFTFDQSGSIGAPVVSTQGVTGLDFADAGTGTCTTSNGAGNPYASGATCTVDVTFTPAYTGPRYGSVQLRDTSSNTIATAYIYGSGSGSQIAFAPPAQSTLSASGEPPYGVAVDASNNVYIAQAGSVMKVTPSGAASVVADNSVVQFPQATAVDGSGNVYIADGSGKVLMVPWNGAAYGTAIALGGSLSTAWSSPYGIAVDGSGNIFVVDQGSNNRVVKIPPTDLSCSTASDCVTNVGGASINFPYGVAVDGGGNVYVSSLLRYILKVPSSDLSCSAADCPSWVTGSSGQPWGLALDANNNIYVADYANNSVLKLPWNGSSYGSATTFLSGLSSPAGVALAGNGNLYVANTGSVQVLKEDYADAPTLLFPPAGGTQAMMLEDIGNGNLTFALPAAITFSFSLDGSTTCPIIVPGTLNAGAACTVAVDFTPGGATSGTLTLSDNNLNASPFATQIIPLSVQTAQVIVNTSPAGLAFSVNGTPYTTPQTFTAAAGTSYTLATTSPQTGSGAQYTFVQWSDGTATTTDTVAPAANTTYTADFNTAFQLTVSATAGGTATAVQGPDAGSYYNAGDVIILNASPNPGYAFTGWTGSTADVADPTSPDTTVTINGPETLTANFQAIPNLIVTTASDATTGVATNCTGGGTNCSLRDALAAAQTAGANITFSFNAPTTITLGSAGTLNIPSYTTITGPTTGSGATLTNIVTVSGANQYTVFTVAPNVGNANIAHLNIANGNGVLSSGAFQNTGVGGIFNEGRLTVSNSSFTNNTGTDNGGGGGIGAIFNTEGELAIVNCSFNNNTGIGDAEANSFGIGGIFNGFAYAAVLDSTFNGNTGSTSGAGGAGIGGLFSYFDSLAIVTSSTFYNNSGNSNNSTSLLAGGFANSDAEVAIGNSTFYNNNTNGNQPLNAGGIYTDSQMDLADNIVSGNNAPTGAVPDIASGTFTDDGGNLIGSTSLYLAPLGNYGGPTQTMIPLPGSSAICAGTATPAGPLTLPPTDQRGFPPVNTIYIPGNTCVDTGAAQSNYSLSFSAQPAPITPATSIVTGSAFTAAVQLDESGTAFNPSVASGTSASTSSANPIVLTLEPTANGTVTGNSATPDGTGIASYSTLLASQAGTGDTLQAALTLTASGAATPVTINSISGTFDVDQEVELTLTPSVTPSSSYVYGTAVPSVSVSLTSSTGIAVSDFTATLDGTTSLTVSTASAANTFAISGIPALLGAGSHSIMVNLAATGDHLASSVTIPLTVTQASSTTTLSASAASLNPGQSVTLTAQVKSATTGTPTGSVNFYDGATLLGSATLTAGSASFTTTALTAGVTNSLTATYVGDTNFTTSTSSSAVSIPVTALDFSLTIGGVKSETVTAGAIATYTFYVSPKYGVYPADVTFAASGLPNGATVTFSPASIAANGGTTTVVMQIQTAAINAQKSNPFEHGGAPLVLSFLLLPLLGTRRMRSSRFGRGMVLLLVVAAGVIGLASLSGCGLGSSSKAQSTPNYTVTVAVTSGSVQHTFDVDLGVNP
jgi:uncharacterized repeat protein (TIGR02543 family)